MKLSIPGLSAMNGVAPDSMAIFATALTIDGSVVTRRSTSWPETKLTFRRTLSPLLMNFRTPPKLSNALRTAASISDWS
ncbi:MAG: hypothetical protein IJR98_02795 [Synergistaceae bacterium]|nr:hypothetical protein [Synergistaceae bacterium]